ncbi:hypothetical protein TSUD_220330 [Trifolium subterraneum]|uniref:Replication protein A 70 kDa DNA-binding subunit B/D first OB fold domain-containing protein n=1 Tax=Trifolium subterraneum TaxID=3900 RepID=A0A2Z6N4F1_TRISU|nr:hypothetical protein TSUD_220330 [Trifolium subterraneum]
MCLLYMYSSSGYITCDTAMGALYQGLINGKETPMELVLLDEERNKIQASIPSECVAKFGPLLIEGCAYIISFFRVDYNSGSCMVTFNKNKITFCMRTEVTSDESSVIDYYGLTLFSYLDLSHYKYGLSNLVDVIGVLTSIRYKYVNDPNEGLCNTVKIELNDQRGKIVCVLSGKIVEDFCKIFLVSCIGLPIIAIQFVKISVVEGDVCLHSIESVSRVLLNPPIAEVVKFKMTMSVGGSMSPVFYGGRNPIVRIPEEYQIEGLFHVDQWWYPVFHCGTFLTICSGYYFCDNCHVAVFSVTSKHTLQIAVGDGTSIVLLQMFDHLLSGIGAINYGDLGIGYALGPDGCMILKGKEVLLIVKKVPHFGDVSDDFVEVVRIIDDHELILQFHLNGKFFTPTKSIVKSAFVGVTPYLNNNGLISCVVDDVVAGKKPIENDPFQFLLISPGVPPPINKGGLKLFDGDSTESSSSNVKNW